MAAQGAQTARRKQQTRRVQAQKSRAPEAKILRIGIIHSGRIVEERLIPSGQTVTVGESPKCTVVIAPGAVPSKKFEIFSFKSGRYELHFTTQMHGKVAVSDQVVTLASLSQRGQAKKRGNYFSLNLTDRNRGKVYVGEYTVLFQFVTPPPQPVRHRSSDFRGWRWQEVDWVFLGVLLFSALVHTAAVVWIESQPPPRRVRLQDFPDRFVRMILPPEDAQPIVEDISDAGEVEVEATPAESEATPEPTPAEAAGGEEAGGEEDVESAEERRERLEESVADKGILALIGTTGDASRGGQIADLLADASGLSGDVGDALSGSSGVAIARRDVDQAGLRGGGGGDGAAGIGDLGAAGGGAGGTVEKKQTAPKPVLEQGPVELSSGNAGDVRSQMNRYLPRIKACYERELRGEPDLAGKVTVSWLIGGAGRAEDTAVEANTTGNSALGACIVREINKIKFKPPADDEDEIEVAGYPFIFSSQ
jgi:hypothetical protein